jgi:hypothetical protein
LLAVLSLGVAGSAPYAEAKVEFEAEAVPNVVDFPDTRRLRYELRMQTGASGEEFRVNFFPRFSFDHARDGFFRQITLEASALPAALPTLVGPGEIEVYEPRASLIPPLPGPINWACYRGPRSRVGPVLSVTVSLGPQAESVLSFPLVTSPAPPWPGADYGGRFTIQKPDGDGVIGAVQVPSPTLTGQRGVKIDLSLEHGEAIGGGLRRMVIRGETHPRLNREWIGLRSERIRPRGKTRFLGGARTDARGHFRYVWRARRHRLYEITASYNSQNPDLASDRTCARSAGVDWNWP